MFSILAKTNFNFSVTLNLLSANAFNLDHSKNLSFGKGLTLYHTSPTFNDPKEEGLGKHCRNKSSKLSQDTPVLPQVVKLGYAPDKIQV